MAKRLCTMLAAAALAVSSVAVSAADLSPVGRWRTLDDDTGAKTGVIEITLAGDTLQGRIVDMVMKPGENPDPVCLKCTGADKNHPIMGLTILKGLRRDGDVWDGGVILDPWTGNVYSSEVRLDETGTKLFVRGYLGISLLGRTETWIRDD